MAAALPTTRRLDAPGASGSPSRSHPPAGIRSPRDSELPDPRLFWRWVGRAVRPYAGWLITAVGALVILIGYLGVSRNALVAKQLPYLISGGIGGIALVGVGAVFLGTEELRRDSGRLDRLERMVIELHAVLLDRPDAPEIPTDASLPAKASQPGQWKVSGRTNGKPNLVALPVGHSYHRPDCTMVQGKPAVGVVTDRQVADRGLKPCRLCEPDQSDLLPW